MPKRFLNYMHLKLGNGRITCAIDHTPRNQFVDNRVFVGVSFCSPKDVFVKKRGREKAFGRLRTFGNMTFSFIPDTTRSFKAQVRERLQSYIDRKCSYVTEESLDEVHISIPTWAEGETLI